MTSTENEAQPELDLLDQKTRINTRELAAYLRKSPGTIHNWASRGYGPIFTKVGGERLYESADVKTWLAELKQEQVARRQVA